MILLLQIWVVRILVGTLAVHLAFMPCSRACMLSELASLKQYSAISLWWLAAGCLGYGCAHENSKARCSLKSCCRDLLSSSPVTFILVLVGVGQSTSSNIAISMKHTKCILSIFYIFIMCLRPHTTAVNATIVPTSFVTVPRGEDCHALAMYPVLEPCDLDTLTPVETM